MGLLNYGKKSKLLALQKIVIVNSPNKLVMSEQQLHKQAENIANNDLRIINDCTKLIDSTINPNVFFERYDLLIERLKHLVLFQPYLNFSGILPSIALNKVIAEKSSSTLDFLSRYYDSVDAKAKSLKTEKAKIARYQKFYDSLQKFYPLLSKEQIDCVEKCKPFNNVN